MHPFSTSINTMPNRCSWGGWGRTHSLYLRRRQLIMTDAIDDVWNALSLCGRRRADNLQKYRALNDGVVCIRVPLDP